MGNFNNQLMVENLNDDFLELLTRTHAADVSDGVGGGSDFDNWLMGKKLTALSILEMHVRQCKNNGSCNCPELPKCAVKYIEGNDISILKKLKAHIVWKDSGRKFHERLESREEEYLRACNQIIWFCDYLPIRNKKCNYNEVLKITDRRNGSSDRRLRMDRRNWISQTPFEKSVRGEIKDRRWAKDRRMIDHRGWAARFLS